MECSFCQKTHVFALSISICFRPPYYWDSIRKRSPSSFRDGLNDEQTKYQDSRWSQVMNFILIDKSTPAMLTFADYSFASHLKL